MIRVGIIGAGHIAIKMADTLRQMPDACALAVASRDIDKAREFASRWNIPRAYGSYAELCADGDIDLVYIATPHSLHFEHVKMALEAGRNVLCEKPFTLNAAEARELIALSKEKGLFLAEALWTRCMPLYHKVSELLSAGAIGRPRLLNASLCYAMEDKQRILRRDLGGGTLLDVGIYTLNFARMFFGFEGIARVEPSVVMGGDGVDMYESIFMQWEDGRVATLQSGALCRCNREGLICGDDGYIVVDNINVSQSVSVYKNYQLVEQYLPDPDQITGFEYQVRACADAISRGLTQAPELSLDATVSMMEMMDGIRAKWGFKWPKEEKK